MIPFDLSFHTTPTLKPAGMAQQQRKSMAGLITLIVVLAAHLIAGNYFYHDDVILQSHIFNLILLINLSDVFFNLLISASPRRGRASSLRKSIQNPYTGYK